MAKKGKVQAEKEKRIKENAERWKEYFTRLEKIMDDIGGKGTFALIPKKQLIILFIARNQSMRIVNSKEMPIPDKTIKSINKYFGTLMRVSKLHVLPNNYEISIRDFINVWLSIHCYLRQFRKLPDEWAKEVVKRLENHINNDTRASYVNKVSFHLDMFSYQIGRLPFYAVWLDSKIQVVQSTASLSWEIVICTAKVITRQIKYKNEERTVYPIFMSIQGVNKQVTYTLNEIGKETAFGNLSVEVCVMEHAIKRLQERLNCIDTLFLQTNYATSLRFPRFHYESDDKVLIEYRINQIKVGYFVAEYIEGLLLIRTFLFLTNNGTPEGRRLNELTGLSKMDKKYLQIDQLKAFYDSDIEENEHLKKLFVDAGCGGLFEIRKFFIANDKPAAKIASFIDHYLTTGEFDENIDFEEEVD